MNFSAETTSSSSYSKQFPSVHWRCYYLCSGHWVASTDWGHSVRSPAGILMAEFKIETHAKLQSFTIILEEQKLLFIVGSRKLWSGYTFASFQRAVHPGKELGFSHVVQVWCNTMLPSAASVTRSDGIFFERLTADQNLCRLHTDLVYLASLLFHHALKMIRDLRGMNYRLY